MNYAAVIPAAGKATRLGLHAGSKEILPVGPQDAALNRPRVAIEHLLDALRLVDVDEIYVVVRDGKWDIPEFLGDGSRYGLSIAYLQMGLPYGVPYTVDQAHPFVADKSVLFGFPDILFQPDNAFQRLTQRLEENDVEVVLGLFPTDRPSKMDMVRCADDGWVAQIEIKPAATDLQYAWCLAAWKPVFTQFLHNFVLEHKEHFARPEALEPQIGSVLQAAIDKGISVAAEIFEGGEVIDIGTQGDLRRVRERFGFKGFES